MKAAVAVVAVILFISNVMAWGQSLAGKFDGQGLSVELQAAPGNRYSGEIILGQQHLPLTATVAGSDLNGTFTSGTDQFSFTASLKGDDLTLVSDGTTYNLHRQKAAENPLAKGAAANPLTQQAGEAPHAPADRKDRATGAYTVLAKTESGKTLLVQKPGKGSAADAISATAVELAKEFDTKPTITGAFADKQQQSRGGATFTAKRQGKAIRGTILCGGDDKGQSITVIYARADAPASEWNTLAAALPNPVKTRHFDFPDGTGSIELPEGWKTPNDSVVGGVVVNGPADQVVSLGRGISVATPDSTAVQMQRQMEMQAQQMGFPPPPPMMLFVAPFEAPEQALRDLIPQISNFSRRARGPSITLTKIIDSQPAQANLPGAKAALINYTWIKGDGPDAIHYRSVIQLECYPLQDASQAWGAFFSELSAPEATFDRDMPIMWALARSAKTNDQAVADKTHELIQQSNQRFATFQRLHKENTDAFDRYEQSMKHNEVVRDRSNADFDEMIRGYRTVEDTRTGERTDANLYDAKDIVEKLNQSDPDRYKEIPLRDQVAPLPGQ